MVGGQLISYSILKIWAANDSRDSMRGTAAKQFVAAVEAEAAVAASEKQKRPNEGKTDRGWAATTVWQVQGGRRCLPPAHGCVSVYLDRG